jgi:hypothetical protein
VLLALFIYWSYSTSERGALVVEVDAYLVGYLAIRLQHYYIWADYSTKIFHASTSFIFFLNRAGFSSLLPRTFIAISTKILI